MDFGSFLLKSHDFGFVIPKAHMSFKGIVDGMYHFMPIE
jgi:hypothetical protein